MWKSFENVGLHTSEKVNWGKNKKETCAKHKIDRSQNGRSNNNNKFDERPHRMLCRYWGLDYHFAAYTAAENRNAFQ